VQAATPFTPALPAPTQSSPQLTPSPTPDSPPIRLIIPALSLDVLVVEIGWRIVGTGPERRSEWQTPDYAAGHHINSANPGQAGNVVISGHHNIKGKVFEPISQDVDREEPRLKPGSGIQIYAADGRSYTYQVEQILLLQEEGATEEERRRNARWMAPTQEPTLTLITYWPLWTNTHRVIVVARLKMDQTAATGQ
jgi:sortase A